MILGSTEVTPTPVRAISATIASAVELGSLSVTPAIVTAIAYGFDPAVVLGQLIHDHVEFQVSITTNAFYGIEIERSGVFIATLNCAQTITTQIERQVAAVLSITREFEAEVEL